MSLNYGNGNIDTSGFLTQEASYAAPDYVFLIKPDGTRYIPPTNIPKTDLTMPKTDTFKKSSSRTKQVLTGLGILAATTALIFGIKKYGSSIIKHIKNIKKPAATPKPPTP